MPKNKPKVLDWQILKTLRSSSKNMRRILKQSALVRDNTFKGGIKEYVKQMSKIGKFAGQLKIAGYMSIEADVVSSGVTVYEAAPEDKVRTTVVETAKVGAGIGFGAFASVLIIGLASGGTGLVIIGIVAVSAALAGKATTELAGWSVGETYDYIEDIRSR